MLFKDSYLKVLFHNDNHDLKNGGACKEMALPMLNCCYSLTPECNSSY